MAIWLPSKRSGWLLAAAILLSPACNNSSPTAPEPNDPPPPDGEARPLPAAFRLDGSASSSHSDGTTVSCVMDLRFELTGPARETPGGLEYEGVHGGALRRTVLDARGNGISLWPSVHGATVVRSLATGRVEISIPANVDAEGRFWRELARIDGRFDAAGQVTGSWECAPFDIDQGGWVDRSHTAQGSWTLVPDP